VGSDDRGVTVLAATRAWGPRIERLLAALRASDDPGVHWQVIVVVNAPARPEVPPVPAPEGVEVRIAYEERRGASHARNTGIDLVTTPWTALLDDDVVPDRRWLAELIAGVTEHGFDLAGGTVTLDPTVPLPPWLEPSLHGFLTALDLGSDVRALTEDEFVLTANAIVRTPLLRDLRFDPRLGPRPGGHLTNDDLDLVRRARTSGARVGWLPSAEVIHEVPPERLRLRWLLARAYQQGRSDRRLAAEEAAAARLGGVRAGWWYLRDRTAHWWRRRTGARSFAVRAAVELVRTLGWWRESVVTRLRS
jgi:GT2 family glycosyltransferase